MEWKGHSIAENLFEFMQRLQYLTGGLDKVLILCLKPLTKYLSIYEL